MSMTRSGEAIRPLAQRNRRIALWWARHPVLVAAAIFVLGFLPSAYAAALFLNRFGPHEPQRVGKALLYIPVTLLNDTILCTLCLTPLSLLMDPGHSRLAWIWATATLALGAPAFTLLLSFTLRQQ
jgi:adenine-specific DNA methylase